MKNPLESMKAFFSRSDAEMIEPKAYPGMAFTELLDQETLSGIDLKKDRDRATRLIVTQISRWIQLELQKKQNQNNYKSVLKQLKDRLVLGFSEIDFSALDKEVNSGQLRDVQDILGKPGVYDTFGILINGIIETIEDNMKGVVGKQVTPDEFVDTFVNPLEASLFKQLNGVSDGLFLLFYTLSNNYLAPEDMKAKIKTEPLPENPQNSFDRKVMTQTWIFKPENIQNVAIQIGIHMNWILLQMENNFGKQDKNIDKYLDWFDNDYWQVQIDNVIELLERESTSQGVDSVDSEDFSRRAKRVKAYRDVIVEYMKKFTETVKEYAKKKQIKDLQDLEDNDYAFIKEIQAARSEMPLSASDYSSEQTREELQALFAFLNTLDIENLLFETEEPSA